MVDFKSMLEEEMSTREEYVEGVPSDIVTASQLHPLFDLEAVKVESLVAAAKIQLVEYVEKVGEMFHKAEALSIDSESTNVQATELGTTAMALFKKLDQKREDLIEKPQAYVKSINSIVKALTEKLYSTKKDDVTVVSMTKEKITQYRAVEEQRRREREQAQQKAADELQKKLNKEAKKTGTEPIQVAMPVLSKKPTTTRTETGSAHGRKYWTFEVEDVGYIQSMMSTLDDAWLKMSTVDPPEGIKQEFRDALTKLRKIVPYLVYADSKIRDAIKGGLRNPAIPGINIFEKDDTSFRT